MGDFEWSIGVPIKLKSRVEPEILFSTFHLPPSGFIPAAETASIATNYNCNTASNASFVASNARRARTASPITYVSGTNSRIASSSGL